MKSTTKKNARTNISQHFWDGFRSAFDLRGLSFSDTIYLFNFSNKLKNRIRKNTEENSYDLMIYDKLTRDAFIASIKTQSEFLNNKQVLNMMKENYIKNNSDMAEFRLLIKRFKESYLRSYEQNREITNERLPSRS